MVDADSGFFAQTTYDKLQQPQELKLLSSGVDTSESRRQRASCSMIWRGNRDGRFRIFKCLRPERRGDPLYERMLRKEFEIGYNLQHPNICNFYSFTALPELGNCIEMEWIDGCTLEELAADGTLTDRNLCHQIISEICDALSYMHAKHIVHRDLKPSNILISHIGKHVSLIDFGLSDSESHSILKSPAGTQFFAAPELVSGLNPDWRSDIYSLGRTIASTMKPFGNVARKCCRDNREKRYQSAQEVKLALNRRGGWKNAGIAAAASTALAAIILTAVPRIVSTAVPTGGSIPGSIPGSNPPWKQNDDLERDVTRERNATREDQTPQTMMQAGTTSKPEAKQASNAMQAANAKQAANASPAAGSSAGINLQERRITAPKAKKESNAQPVDSSKIKPAEKAAETIDAAAIDSLFRKATELFD